MYGKIIAALRNERKLTQREFAQTLKIATSTISMYEKENREPDIATIVKIAEYFDVSVDYLLGVSRERGRYGENLLVCCEAERALLGAFRTMDENERCELRGFLRGFEAGKKCNK